MYAKGPVRANRNLAISAVSQKKLPAREILNDRGFAQLYPTLRASLQPKDCVIHSLRHTF